MSEEEVSPIPRGLTLEEAHNLRRDRQLEKLTKQMAELMKRLDHRDRSSSRSSSKKPKSSSSSSESEEESPRRRRRKPRDESSSEEDVRRKRKSKPKDDDRSLKLDFPEFSGSMLEPEKYFEWVRRAEALFDYKEYDEEAIRATRLCPRCVLKDANFQARVTIC